MSDYDDDDYRPRRRYRCPSCGSRMTPVYVSKISPAGWVVFWLGIWFCLIGLVGLVMKVNQRVCPECGKQIRGRV